MIRERELKELLDGLVVKYNRPDFISNDPIIIPHQFRDPREIEITGLFAAVFAWGQRKTIINKCNELLALMDRAPIDFILNFSDMDLKRFKGFVHRTFQYTDLLHFFKFFQNYYSQHDSMEALFLKGLEEHDNNMMYGITEFRNVFFQQDHEKRTEKHVSNPLTGSSCKRINMFLRWMVRKDNNGVDFGIWKRISPSLLICPLDVHVIRVANEFGLLKTDKANWNTAVELTDKLRKFCPEDPVKYDFALFGYGVDR